jgi:hypothetical protein
LLYKIAQFLSSPSSCEFTILLSPASLPQGKNVKGKVREPMTVTSILSSVPPCGHILESQVDHGNDNQSETANPACHGRAKGLLVRRSNSLSQGKKSQHPPAAPQAQLEIRVGLCSGVWNPALIDVLIKQRLLSSLIHRPSQFTKFMVENNDLPLWGEPC